MVEISEAARSPALLPTCETVGLAKPVKIRADETFVPEEMIDVPCRACGRLYHRGVAVIYLEAGDGPELGEICPTCVSEGSDQIARMALFNVTRARAAEETVGVCPTPEKLALLERAIGRPRYASVEGAEWAYRRRDLLSFQPVRVDASSLIDVSRCLDLYAYLRL